VQHCRHDVIAGWTQLIHTDRIGLGQCHTPLTSPRSAGPTSQPPRNAGEGKCGPWAALVSRVESEETGERGTVYKAQWKDWDSAQRCHVTSAGVKKLCEEMRQCCERTQEESSMENARSTWCSWLCPCMIAMPQHARATSNRSRGPERK